MKTSELSGDLLNRWIAYIGLTEARLYTRDMQVYTLPHLYPGHAGRLFIVAANTGLDRTKPIPPKFYRSAAPVPFDPVNNAAQGLPIIEHFGLTLSKSGNTPTPEQRCISHSGGISDENYQCQFGSTYLEAGLRTVVATCFGEDVPDEVPL